MEIDADGIADERGKGSDVKLDRMSGVDLSSSCSEVKWGNEERRG